MMKKSSVGWYLLGAIFILGIFLRVYNIPNTLLFHFDQGYHGLAIKEIWENKRIALLGHKTDVEGVFHGSVFYYLALPFYLVSSWNPAGVSFLFALLDAFSIIFIFLIGKKLFGEKVGFLAGLLYATSYSVVSYSRWLSNVTLIPFFSSIFFYLLVKGLKENLFFFVFACFFAGLMIQLNGAIGFFFLPLLIFLVFWKRKKFFAQKKYLAGSIVFFLLPSLPLIFFEARHNLLVSRSIFRLFFQEGNLGFNVAKVIKNLTLLETEIINLFSYKIPLISLALVILTVLAVIMIFARKEKVKDQVELICLFVLVPFLGLVFYQGGIHAFFIMGLLPVLVIFFSWGLIFWGEKGFLRLPIFVLVLAIIFLNLYHWQGFLKPGFNLIPIGTRNLITLKDRKEAADFMYQESGGMPFKTLIYIIPYFQEQPWDYVFSWYGKSNYGYLPNPEATKTFVIYEPDYDFPYRLTNWLGKIGEDHGGMVSSFKTHDLIVEEREK